MDCIALVDQAQKAGLRISVQGDRLIVRGPKQAGDLAEVLLAHKGAVIALLAGDLKTRITRITRNTPKPAADAGATDIPGLELEAHARQAELVIITYRLRNGRTMPLDEAEQLFAAYQGKLAEWRAFLNEHASADTAELLGDLDEQLRAHVARMRRTLHEPRGPPGRVVW
jgi:hypothetical protein